MAELDLTKAKKITIENVVKSDEIMNSAVGERVLTSYSEIKEDIERGVYVDFEYALDKYGNFQYYSANGGLKAIDTNTDVTPNQNGDPEGSSGKRHIKADEIAVIVRKSIKATDRYIQFYRTQQKILLAQNEKLILKVDRPDAYAHYMALAIEGEIKVTAADAE